MENDIIVRDESGLSNQEFYQALLEDCQAIVVERGFRARMEAIEGKWELGKRIYEENEQMDRQKIYGDKIVENLSRDLGISNSNLFSCIQFYKQFQVPEFDEVVSLLPGGKETSWSKIMNDVLGQRKEDRGPREKTVFKLTDVCEVARLWLQSDLRMTNELEIVDCVSSLKEMIIRYKSEK